MAYVCEICGKSRQKAHKISHSNVKTRKFQEPNLQRVHALVDGQPKHLRVCTGCIRSGKVTKAV